MRIKWNNIALFALLLAGFFLLLTTGPPLLRAVEHTLANTALYDSETAGIVALGFFLITLVAIVKMLVRGC